MGDETIVSEPASSAERTGGAAALPGAICIQGVGSSKAHPIRDSSAASVFRQARSLARGVLAGLFVYHCSFGRKLKRALGVSTPGPEERSAATDRASAIAGLFPGAPAQERLPVLCGLSGLRCGGLTRLPFLRF
jgi:hypothetical protein